jgi:hypothetical protein
MFFVFNAAWTGRRIAAHFYGGLRLDAAIPEICREVLER